jgi:hypothetical protein
LQRTGCRPIPARPGARQGLHSSARAGASFTHRAAAALNWFKGIEGRGAAATRAAALVQRLFIA